MELPYEIQIMARTVYGEARNQPWQGLVAVAEVIRNRAAKPSWWGTDISTVCGKPYQFSCWNLNDPNRLVILDATFDELRQAIAACLFVLSTKSNITNGATSYHTLETPKGTKVWPPDWAKEMTKVAVVGSHVFYK